uniref:Integrase catalytic domain-containing protein n=1 Tax=Sipha flava TaxID=143950 RepID=A0A2S2R5S9_9HEMI
MQVLWIAGIGWDDVIPSNAHNIWQQYRDQLPCLQKLRIPRRITTDTNDSNELHAFSDSSEKGYAAAIYLRTKSSTGVVCHLVTAKSKVAPFKRVTIPRLELCGALLAAKLLKSVVDVLSPVLDITCTHAWTDSMTTLAWIKSSPHRWTTFVANRVSQLQDLTTPSIWRYVPTKVNPVDCASRGIFLSELLNHPQWWGGPEFLYDEHTSWPKTHSIPAENTSQPESRLTVALTATKTDDIFDRLFEWYSSLTKIVRIIGYCFRLKQHYQATTTLNPTEQHKALDAIIKAVQWSAFNDDIRLLTANKPCSTQLRRLSPFLDASGILRVGRRIQHASIPYEQKHPALVPKRHPFTSILIHHYHKENCHPGSTTLQRLIQQRFWIISARQVIRSHLRLCIPCYRVRPKHIQPTMGNLPVCRLQQIKPFHATGVDYAGPIPLKERRTRNAPVSHAYICLFVCMSTKALHLEVASTLSTETFLMAFTRFAARRGPIQAIYSDCGTNFVGASRLFKSVPEYQNAITNHLSTQQIQRHFNPPSAPHFGGLWEAGVKSVKQLLYRSIGNQRLTSEELSTCLTRIEATLNSRPLSAMSNDPADFNALTPNHFLTLEPSTTIPDPDLSTLPISKMQRWRLLRDIHQHFWSQWKSDFINTLQQRVKWTKDNGALHQDDLVLIKEPTSSLQWRLGRIVQLHPGNDGINRVATVKTTTGTFKRPAIKLCPLPQN